MLQLEPTIPFKVHRDDRPPEAKATDAARSARKLPIIAKSMGSFPRNATRLRQPGVQSGKVHYYNNRMHARTATLRPLHFQEDASWHVTVLVCNLLPIIFTLLK